MNQVTKGALEQPRPSGQAQKLLTDLGLEWPEELVKKFCRLRQARSKRTLRRGQVWKYNSFEYSDEPVASAIYLKASFHSHAPWPASNHI